MRRKYRVKTGWQVPKHQVIKTPILQLQAPGKTHNHCLRLSTKNVKARQEIKKMIKEKRR